jgi:hypothetical protein
VDLTAQEKILADLDRRWTESLLDERHRERAKLLVMMLRQLKDSDGEVPAHHRSTLQARMDSLVGDLPRMTLGEADKCIQAIKLVGDSLPDPSLGTAFHKRVEESELEEIRVKHPVMRLKPAVEERLELNGQACLPAETQDGEPPEDVEESPEVTDQEWLSESGCWEPPGAPVEAPNCYRSQEWFDAQPGGSHSNGNPGPARPISSAPSRLVPGSERWILEQKKTSNPAPCPPIKKKAPKKPSESSKRPIDVVMAYRPRRQYRR